MRYKPDFRRIVITAGCFNMTVNIAVFVICGVRNAYAFKLARKIFRQHGLPRGRRAGDAFLI